MSAAILIKNAKVITPAGVWERGWLVSRDRHIDLMGSGDAPAMEHVETIDANGLTLLPGFIDVHVHGAVGHETMDASQDGLQRLAAFFASHGVTAFLPTTWTDTRTRIRAALENIAACIGTQPNGATIVGAHLEGPYISVEKRGAQRIQDVRRADRDEALAFLDLNVIRLLVLAPEYEENLWLIEECVRRGITVSIAHTDATFDQVQRAATLGVTHATHTYNAMRGLNHREPGALGAVLTNQNIGCELIADNIHVHPAAMQLLYACKGQEHVILITDSVRSTGLPDGEYAIDERTVRVKDGVVRLPDGTLAGSTLTMDRALQNFMRATGQPLEAIWQTSSLNAARSIHLADRKGSLEVGKDADLVLVDEQINVHLTVAEGAIVYRKPGF
jgi:N-acetylglucosamine-6-phosphate deacetylase